MQLDFFRLTANGGLIRIVPHRCLSGILPLNLPVCFRRKWEKHLTVLLMWLIRQKETYLTNLQRSGIYGTDARMNYIGY
ncbi:predicted protein [Methanosarcina acetivorans C2A]|uniref:Uncharacterized protein n=1 Tax=Methanosarcina acetivorans (strain ATCC 35395 / DSM 2834 / JCM 12185 / C2A) TaxID=188937 RepID=Q8TL76_METAC|nr:predicted protein [Methanosarcina acetivorans C2A]